jgi:hypothetical protein
MTGDGEGAGGISPPGGGTRFRPTGKIWQIAICIVKSFNSNFSNMLPFISTFYLLFQKTSFNICSVLQLANNLNFTFFLNYILQLQNSALMFVVFYKAFLLKNQRKLYSKNHAFLKICVKHSFTKQIDPPLRIAAYD